MRVDSQGFFEKEEYPSMNIEKYIKITVLLLGFFHGARDKNTAHHLP